jgi:hypothetical protein
LPKLVIGKTSEKIGDAVDAQQHRLAIDDGAGVTIAQCRLDDARIAAPRVVAVARERPHPVAIPLVDQAVAVVLDLVEPISAVGNFRSLGGT